MDLHKLKGKYKQLKITLVNPGEKSTGMFKKQKHNLHLSEIMNEI